ncbi:glycoside hydrolase family 5 protein [Treponema bryantii]|uniref:glycoside hydrolase family 5 protein n=1 Tax=Treponema bryantii TaxID=163 RepID=UPI0003B65661|nr:glycoside hydrolase family 5 protein [Treponema bryantii]
MRIKSNLFKSLTILILSTTITFTTFAQSKKINTSLSAMDLAKQMECGWNLGNSLDARDNWSAQSKKFPFNQGVGSEAVWGEEITTKAIIETGIKNGYKTIRLPVTWCNHLVDTNYTIDPKWMARVKEIVDWSIDAGYYVILNEHHSVHDDMSNPLKHCEGYIVHTGDEKESKAFLQAIWKQISETFNDNYDEHLIFETMNEPRNSAHEHCWNPQPKSCKECKADVQLLNELNQLILDTIRASGGNNANRFVMIPGMGTSISTALADYFVLPKDSANDRLLVTVHLYPLDAGGTRNGSHHFNSQTRNEIITNFRLLDKKFSSKGIPVVLGECGASRIGGTVWEGNVQKQITDYVVTYEDRLNCFSFLASQTGKYTMPLLNWDCGGTDYMATIDRKNCKVVEAEYNAAVIKAWQDANKNPAATNSSIEDESISLEHITAWDKTKVSYDEKTKTLNLKGSWQGCDIWLGSKDISEYSNLILKYKATASFTVEVRYADENEGKKSKAASGTKTLKIPLDKSKKVKQILFMSENSASKITFESIVFSIK